MKLSNVVVNNNGIVLKRLISSPVDITYLNLLPTDSSRLKCMYKKFYRLRYMIDNDKHNINRYQEIIRWRFQMEDFNLKRKVILEKQDVLDQQQMFKRILNTLAFVHNSTVALNENPPPLQHYHELKANRPIEKQILLTILKMHYKLPPDIKYDRKFQWFEQYKTQLQLIPAIPTKKLLQKANPYIVGYIDYMMSIMAVNEQLNLCL